MNGENKMNRFEDEIKGVLESVITNKPHLTVVPQYPLTGLSGNSWKVDFVVMKKLEELEMGSSVDVSAIIECKGPGYKDIRPEPQTYHNHMLRAYAELGDLRNLNVPKFLVVTYRGEKEAKNYDAYFKSIGVERINYENSRDLSRFLETIKKL